MVVEEADELRRLVLTETATLASYFSARLDCAMALQDRLRRRIGFLQIDVSSI